MTDDMFARLEALDAAIRSLRHYPATAQATLYRAQEFYEFLTAGPDLEEDDETQDVGLDLEDDEDDADAEEAVKAALVSLHANRLRREREAAKPTEDATQRINPE
jgi:hypothetical protein